MNAVTAADMIRRGWVVKPSREDGTKDPGVPADTLRMTLEHLKQWERSGAPNRYNVIIGRQDIGFRADIVDFETDGPIGEERLLEACGGEIPAGPYMVTPSGSIHRVFVAPKIPDGKRLSLRKAVLGDGSKVDAMWQFQALDGDKRVWHDWHLPVPPLPETLCTAILIDIVVYEPWDGEVSGGWGGAALTGECEKLAGLGQGDDRNRGAYLAGLKIGARLDSGNLDESEAVARLIEAAKENGSVAVYTLADIERQIRRGITNGKADPRGPAHDPRWNVTIRVRMTAHVSEPELADLLKGFSR